MCDSVSAGREDLVGSSWLALDLDLVDSGLFELPVEVTETALFHVTDAVQTTTRAVADLGVSWWVDDFGTGYSSISHLRDLPITGLKLDLSFTQQITGAAVDRPTMLTKGLVGLADGLGLATIAEGVETQQQANILIAQGWSMGQGWLYGKAAPLTLTSETSPPGGELAH